MDFQFITTEPIGPSQPLSGSDAYEKGVQWSTYTADEASGAKKRPLKQRTVVPEIPLDKLKVSAEQLKQIEEIYRDATVSPEGNSPVDFLYTLGDDGRLAASAVMAQQGLDIDSRERLDNHWSQQWSHNSGKSPKTVNQTRRILYL